MAKEKARPSRPVYAPEPVRYTHAAPRGKYYRGRTVIDFTNHPDADLNED